MWTKLLNNFGAGAIRALGIGGYVRYLATTLAVATKVIAQRSLRPVDIAMHGTVALRHPVTNRRVSIDLDAFRAGDEEEGTYTFGLVREIWMRDVYLEQFSLPDSLDCVIDLGANRGVFVLQACSFASRVVAVEALPGYRQPLLKNLADNGLDNLHLVNAFIGGEGLLAAQGNTVIGLADAVALAEGREIDFMKIDIEGSEFGLDLAPLRQVKRLAMEVHPQWGDRVALIRSVEALGFKCRLFDESLRPAVAETADFVYAINTRFPEATWKN